MLTLLRIQRIGAGGKISIYNFPDLIIDNQPTKSAMDIVELLTETA